MRCSECGASVFAPQLQPRQGHASCKLGAEELPPAAFAQKDGNAIKLRCRTPEEAYLVVDELEKSDILTILPSEEELLAEYKRKGCVELRVSAKAYESLADLRSVVEFQHIQSLEDQPLLFEGKAMALGCAFVILPGLLVFPWLLSNYRKNGYHRMAKEFKLWFFIGVAAWLLLVCGMVALT